MMDKWLPQLRQELNTGDTTSGDTLASSRPDATTAPHEDASDKSNAKGFQGMVRVNAVNVHADSHQNEWEAFIAFQVAQTAVMFLLFSMAGGAGTLLDEQDSGTLERLLTSNVGMTGVLLGKWMFLALIGIAQLCAMFLWAWKPFGLNLWTPAHLGGFAIMTVFTACAAAAFGMILATLCKSRGQLSGVSTIIILTMSAVGGSMFPRFMMSDTMQTIGLTTFNAWALDGYRKVFYDNLPLMQLWPQVLVLGGITVTFLLIARVLARRWEAV
jgi:ABC-2 type transport system permease protein